MTERESLGPCLDYLDKEMTIQGVLSGFSIALAGAIFDRVLGAGQDSSQLIKSLQTNGSSFLFVGCVVLAIACVAFYMQRSDLAILYSEFGLALACCEQRFTRFPSEVEPKSVEECVWELDSWHIWLWYKMGYWCLGIAALALILAFAVTFPCDCYPLPTWSKPALDAITDLSPFGLLTEPVLIYWLLKLYLPRKDDEEEIAYKIQT